MTRKFIKNKQVYAFYRNSVIDRHGIEKPKVELAEKEKLSQQPQTQPQSKQLNRDIDDELALLGFPNDGYDYSKVLRPIGGGIFIPAVYDKSQLRGHKGGITDLVKESEPAPYMYGLEEIAKEYIRDENDIEKLEIDEDLKEALKGDSDFEELDDDFILQANGGNLDGLDGQVESIKDKLKRMMMMDDDEDYDGEGGRPSYRDDRKVVDQVLEAQFDKALEEYQDDDLGELDPEDTKGKYTTDQFEEVFDEFIEEYNENHLPLMTRLENLRRNDPLFPLTEKEKKQILSRDWDKDEDLSEVSEEEDNPQDQWDCETILTTYTNLDNHPKLIREENTKIIKLSKKGIPLGVLPTKKRVEEEEDDDDEEKVNLGQAREKSESKQDKKLRKKQVKEERKLTRENKKELKKAFKKEELKQVNVFKDQQVNKQVAVRF
eukprot:gene7472-9180_t